MTSSARPAILSPPGLEHRATSELLRPLVDCLKCHSRWAPTNRRRVPELWLDESPSPGLQLDVQDPRRAARERGCGRLPAAETAQGMFVNFMNVLQTTRRSRPSASPSGQVIPQRDHAQNFVFRTREFEQMEMDTSSAREATSGSSTGCRALQLYLDLGIPREDPAPPPRERTSSPLLDGDRDVEFLFPWGWTSSRHRQPDRLHLRATARRRASGSSTSTRRAASATSPL